MDVREDGPVLDSCNPAVSYRSIGLRLGERAQGSFRGYAGVKPLPAGAAWRIMKTLALKEYDCRAWLGRENECMEIPR